MKSTIIRDGKGIQKSMVIARGNGSSVDPIVILQAIDGPTPPIPVAINFTSASLQEIIAAPGDGFRIRITRLNIFSEMGAFPVAQLSDNTIIGYSLTDGNADNFVQPLTLGENAAFGMQSMYGNFQVYGQVCYFIEEI